MKRKAMVIVSVCLIFMALGCVSAYADPEGIPTEPATVEVSEPKVETPTPRAEKEEAPDPEVAPPPADDPEPAPPAPEAAPPVAHEPDPEPTDPAVESPAEQEAAPEAPASEGEPPVVDEPELIPDTKPEAQPKAFEGSVTVSVLTQGEMLYGDQVTLKATLKGAANIDYALRWEFNGGNGWQTVDGERDHTYTFTLTEQNARYQWRVVVITAA